MFVVNAVLSARERESPIAHKAPLEAYAPAESLLVSTSAASSRKSEMLDLSGPASTTGRAAPTMPRGFLGDGWMDGWIRERGLRWWASGEQQHQSLGQDGLDSPLDESRCAARQPGCCCWRGLGRMKAGAKAAQPSRRSPPAIRFTISVSFWLMGKHVWMGV